MAAIEVGATQSGALGRLISGLEHSPMGTVLTSRDTPDQLLAHIIGVSPELARSEPRNGLLQTVTNQTTLAWGVFRSAEGSVAIILLFNELNDTEQLSRVMINSIVNPFRGVASDTFVVTYTHFGDTKHEAVVAAVAGALDRDQAELWADREGLPAP